MTPVLLRVSTGPPPRAAVVQPDVEVATTCAALPGVVVLAVRGEVDSCTSPLLRDRLLDHVRPTCRQLVVDLTAVTFLAAAGLTVLVAVREAATAAGVRLFLVADTPAVLRPLMITGLDGVFDVCPDIEHVRLRLGAVAEQVLGGSRDDPGVLPMPRAEPSTPCLA
ncbi:anti-anti-sigma factor [Lentzea waywayandensis]|uniref:Anti-sigma factor antagonist n=1 Tax=Lentzea waywayandensis TaxID=84724 RepID=A0A1I6CS07_9PSEU|nr:STAS domain-containing protein [Lentzea waywayandensis]SFQ95968.1 anti-anti-sigma factor [Lentzea waywayandensis]